MLELELDPELQRYRYAVKCKNIRKRVYREPRAEQNASPNSLHPQPSPINQGC